MDCPFCEASDAVSKMKESTATTPEIQNGFCLTCPSCGFSMTAKTKLRLALAHEILFECYPDQEAC